MNFIVILSLLLPVEDRVGWLGVKGEEISKPYQIALSIDSGIIITDILRDSPAEDGGLKMGDILVKIDDQTIYNMDDLAKIIQENPEEKLTFGIIRKGKEKKVEVKIGQREENFNRIRDEIKKAIRQLKDEIERIKETRI